eukprot:351491-Chlamydomonas_euryale.AAC.16
MFLSMFCSAAEPVRRRADRDAQQQAGTGTSTAGCADSVAACTIRMHIALQPRHDVSSMRCVYIAYRMAGQACMNACHHAPSWSV